jgi:SAM-dependent methyltransferase
MNAFDAIAPFYDVEHGDLLLDTTMYVGLAETSPDPVLVLGCGTGRVVHALQAAGIEAWGIDQSEGMLEIARHKLRPDMATRLVRADMRDFQLAQRFALVVIPLDTFGLILNQDEQIEVLRRAGEHLAPHGRLVIDLSNPFTMPDSDQDGLRRVRFTAVEGNRTVTAWDWTEADSAAQILHMTIEYETREGQSTDRIQVEVDVRWSYRFELEALFALAGLRVESVWGSYDQDEYGESSPRLIITGRRVSST